MNWNLVKLAICCCFLVILTPTTASASRAGFRDYLQCLQSQCEKLFCLTSDRECQYEINKFEDCRAKNQDCLSFTEWARNRNLNALDNTATPESLPLCYKACKSDLLASENYRELENCKYKCVFESQVPDL